MMTLGEDLNLGMMTWGMMTLGEDLDLDCKECTDLGTLGEDLNLGMMNLGDDDFG